MQNSIEAVKSTYLGLRYVVCLKTPDVCRGRLTDVDMWDLLGWFSILPAVDVQRQFGFVSLFSTIVPYTKIGMKLYGRSQALILRNCWLPRPGERT